MKKKNKQFRTSKPTETKPFHIFQSCEEKNGENFTQTFWQCEF